MFKKINSETSGGTNRQKPLAEEDLIRGDHIYVRRGGLLYSHHGIYAGEGTVINFKG
ncbi:MAG: lecithin retinol acyltransferase family protein, partial [Deltaproteobacteria bacterium]|nr:lecithin retinol acyltransferase family protein [Deltaproteobacteria bacterium]